MRKTYIGTKGKPVSRQRDWQIRMAEKGKCVKCARPATRTHCDRCAKKRGIVKRHPLPSQWELVDWSMSERQIAALLDVSVMSVYSHRRSHGVKRDTAIDAMREELKRLHSVQ